LQLNRLKDLIRIQLDCGILHVTRSPERIAHESTMLLTIGICWYLIKSLRRASDGDLTMHDADE
jgi:hypothetical protein